MIIQTPKRITTQGVSNDSKEAVTAVGSAANTFIEEAYYAIMGKLTVADNLNQEYQQVTVKVDSSGYPQSSVKFTTSLSTLTGIVCVRAIGSSYPTGSPFVSFTNNSGTVTVNHVAGLTSGVSYTLYLLLLGA